MGSAVAAVVLLDITNKKKITIYYIHSKLWFSKALGVIPTTQKKKRKKEWIIQVT